MLYNIIRSTNKCAISCRERTEKWLVRRRELINKLKRQHRKYCATTGLSYHKDSREGKQN